MTLAQRSYGSTLATNELLHSSSTPLVTTSGVGQWGKEIQICDGSVFKGGDPASLFEILNLYVSLIDQRLAPMTIQFLRYDVGAPASCTFTIADDRIHKTPLGLADGDKVILPSVNLTTGIDTKTLYYVINIVGDACQLSLSPGGAAVDMTGSDGTGSFFLLGPEDSEGVAAGQSFVAETVVLDPNIANSYGTHPLGHDPAPCNSHLSMRSKAVMETNVEFFLGVTFPAREDVEMCTTEVREVTLPYNPTSAVYRVPVGCYFADNAADVRVWHDSTELVYGVGFTAYYNGKFNTSYSQPASVQDASSGVVLTTIVASGTIKIRWVERTLPIAPRVVGVARFYYDGLWWLRDTLNPWNSSNPATVPNAIYVSVPPSGYVLELWRMTRHQGGLTPHGTVGHGPRMIPYLRGPQVGVTENDRAIVIDPAHIGGTGTKRRKFRVCWYNPTTRTRSLFAPQLIVLNASWYGDRHNGGGVVRARYGLWIEGT